MLAVVIYHVIPYLDRLFYSFIDGFLSNVRNSWNNVDIEVILLDANSASTCTLNDDN